MPSRNVRELEKKYINTPEKKLLALQFDSNLKLSVRLKELREKEGYTQSELAAIANKLGFVLKIDLVEKNI